MTKYALGVNRPYYLQARSRNCCYGNTFVVYSRRLSSNGLRIPSNWAQEFTEEFTQMEGEIVVRNSHHNPFWCESGIIQQSHALVLPQVQWRVDPSILWLVSPQIEPVHTHCVPVLKYYQLFLSLQWIPSIFTSKVHVNVNGSNLVLNILFPVPAILSSATKFTSIVTWLCLWANLYIGHEQVLMNSLCIPHSHTIC